MFYTSNHVNGKNVLQAFLSFSQLLAVEKKLTTLSAEYRSDICLKMEENKSLTMMLEMMRSKQLSRVCAVSNDEDCEPAAPESHANKAEPASSSSRPLDSPAPDGASLNGSQMNQSPSPLPAVEVGWSGERRQFGIESGTPTTPTPTSSSCCSSGKVTRNVRYSLSKIGLSMIRPPAFKKAG